MRGANHGPYARLLPLRNGHYKRIVDPVVPEIFANFQACCGTDANAREVDFERVLSYPKPREELDLPKSRPTERFDSDLGPKEFNRLHTAKLGTEGATTLEELSTDSEDSQYEAPAPENFVVKRGSDEISIVKRGSRVVGGDSRISSDSGFGSRFGSLHDDEGIPILFYTKTRDKPALLVLTVDPDMQVIYMKRNKVSRFFPIKLIKKFVTSRALIEDEFSRHIVRDPTIRVGNMVMFSATNFTDSVAIQFANERDRSNFMREVNQIMDAIGSKL